MCYFHDHEHHENREGLILALSMRTPRLLVLPCCLTMSVDADLRTNMSTGLRGRPNGRDDDDQCLSR
jgi:hypothetical protein